MTPQATLKAALAFAGLLCFFLAIRLGIEWLRWVAIACVAIAFLLRFARGEPPAEG